MRIGNSQQKKETRKQSVDKETRKILRGKREKEIVSRKKRLGKSQQKKETRKQSVEKMRLGKQSVDKETKKIVRGKEAGKQ